MEKEEKSRFLKEDKYLMSRCWNVSKQNSTFYSKSTGLPIVPNRQLFIFITEHDMKMTVYSMEEIICLLNYSEQNNSPYFYLVHNNLIIDYRKFKILFENKFNTYYITGSNIVRPLSKIRFYKDSILKPESRKCEPRHAVVYNIEEDADMTKEGELTSSLGKEDIKEESLSNKIERVINLIIKLKEIKSENNEELYRLIYELDQVIKTTNSVDSARVKNIIIQIQSKLSTLSEPKSEISKLSNDLSILKRDDDYSKNIISTLYGIMNTLDKLTKQNQLFKIRNEYQTQILKQIEGKEEHIKIALINKLIITKEKELLLKTKIEVWLESLYRENNKFQTILEKALAKGRISVEQYKEKVPVFLRDTHLLANVQTRPPKIIGNGQSILENIPKIRTREECQAQIKIPAELSLDDKIKFVDNKIAKLVKELHNYKKEQTEVEGVLLDDEGDEEDEVEIDSENEDEENEENDSEVDSESDAEEETSSIATSTNSKTKSEIAKIKQNENKKALQDYKEETVFQEPLTTEEKQQYYTRKVSGRNVFYFPKNIKNVDYTDCKVYYRGTYLVNPEYIKKIGGTLQELYEKHKNDLDYLSSLKVINNYGFELIYDVIVDSFIFGLAEENIDILPILYSLKSDLVSSNLRKKHIKISSELIDMNSFNPEIMMMYLDINNFNFITPENEEILKKIYLQFLPNIIKLGINLVYYLDDDILNKYKLDRTQIRKFPNLLILNLKNGSYEMSSNVSRLLRLDSVHFSKFELNPNLVSLEISNTNLSSIDITPLTYLSKLNTLTLIKTNLSQFIDISKLRSLTNLNLSENNLNALTISIPNSTLINLNLFQNKFENIDFIFSLTNLQKLIISKNPVKSIRYKNNHETLSYLEANNCELERLSIKNFTYLLFLSATSNSLTKFEVTENRFLQILKLSSNNIEEIKIDALNLEQILLDYNRLSETPILTRLDRLKVFDLQGNLIQSVNGFASKSRFIFNLSYNAIRSIKPEVFLNTPNISELYLNGNKLTQFTLIRSYENGNASCTATKLAYLDISGNRITEPDLLFFALYTRIFNTIVNSDFKNLNLDTIALPEKIDGKAIPKSKLKKKKVEVQDMVPPYLKSELRTLLVRDLKELFERHRLTGAKGLVKEDYVIALARIDKDGELQDHAILEEKEGDGEKKSIKKPKKEFDANSISPPYNQSVLTKLTKPQLAQLCAKHGLNCPTKNKKGDYIELLIQVRM